jgi:hypothetical protein
VGAFWVGKADKQEDFTPEQLSKLESEGYPQVAWDRSRSVDDPPGQQTLVTVNAGDEVKARQEIADCVKIDAARLTSRAAGPDRRTEW